MSKPQAAPAFAYETVRGVGKYIAIGELMAGGKAVRRFAEPNVRECNTVMITGTGQTPAEALAAAQAKEKIGWALAKREGLL